MKQISKLFTVCCLVFITTIHAQEKPNCGENFSNALLYLQGENYTKKDSLKAVKLLKPCIKLGDDNAELLMSRLYASQKNEKSYKKAFKLLKKSAKQENAIAMADLGIMYKYGRGCKLNFNKARKWFKKSAELGNDKANYSLGYLYLKGFGHIEQDYKKAVTYFKKSEYPMAKYWLGTCYYYGYGVQQNIQKANELLNTEFETLINETLETETSGNETENSIETTEIQTNVNDSSQITNNAILGSWSGTLLQLDWSGKHIEQKIPVKFNFTEDVLNNISYVIQLDKQEINGNVTKLENTLYFEELSLELPHTSFNKEIPNKLFYEILSSNLSTKSFGDKTYLTGDLENYIASWNEAGSPLRFVLTKNETFSNSDKELSEEALKELSEQEENFIKLYPNPFKGDLIISYTLQEATFVEVRVADINGTKNTVVEKGKQQEKGKHTYFFNGNNLEKGLYVVTVLTGNEKKTRIIVKK